MALKRMFVSRLRELIRSRAQGRRTSMSKEQKTALAVATKLHSWEARELAATLTFCANVFCLGWGTC